MVVFTWDSYKMVVLCMVVKVLKKSRDNGEEFINEVASISRTSHVNIVSLMGFCFEGSKSARIYEFMPNVDRLTSSYIKKVPLMLIVD
jgi:hypothetical protein